MDRRIACSTATAVSARFDIQQDIHVVCLWSTQLAWLQNRPLGYRTLMEPAVKRWVRIGVAVTLAVPPLIIGIWALMAPKNWFESFPGFDARRWPLDPPYNEHLATDVGAGFLATGVALLVAAVWANRAASRASLLMFVAFTLPHVVYHGDPSSRCASPASRTPSTSVAAPRTVSCWRRSSRGGCGLPPSRSRTHHWPAPPPRRIRSQLPAMELRCRNSAIAGATGSAMDVQEVTDAIDGAFLDVRE